MISPSFEKPHQKVIYLSNFAISKHFFKIYSVFSLILRELITFEIKLSNLTTQLCSLLANCYVNIELGYPT